MALKITCPVFLYVIALLGGEFEAVLPLDFPLEAIIDFHVLGEAQATMATVLQSRRVEAVAPSTFVEVGHLFHLLHCQRRHAIQFPEHHIKGS